MKVAVVHEWLVTWAGAERVLAEILDLFPDSDLFVLFDRLPKDQRKNLPRIPIKETFLARLPQIEKIYRNLLPIMPAAIESLDLYSYDLILSSSHSVGKGVITRPDQLHLCYCHTPPRYLWDMTDAYFSKTFSGRVKKLAATMFFPRLKKWDVEAGQRPHFFMANSRFVAERISRIYGRQSTVVYPPVDIERFSIKKTPGGEYFVTMGRLVPYKNIDLIAKTFRDFSHKLVVVGDGPGRKDLEAIVGGNKNIEWLRWVTDEEWGAILRGARAFLFMAEEDFGIAPVEAMAAGVPVIAWGKGGVLETVKGARKIGSENDVENIPQGKSTGLFYWEATPQSLREGVERFLTLENVLDPQMIRKNAERFSREAFLKNYEKVVREKWAEHEARDWRKDIRPWG